MISKDAKKAGPNQIRCLVNSAINLKRFSYFNTQVLSKTEQRDLKLPLHTNIMCRYPNDQLLNSLQVFTIDIDAFEKYFVQT